MASSLAIQGEPAMAEKPETQNTPVAAAPGLQSTRATTDPALEFVRKRWPACSLGRWRSSFRTELSCRSSGPSGSAFAAAIGREGRTCPRAARDASVKKQPAGG